MTARVTTLKGPDAGAYYVEALPNYYLDSGEPRGRWHGRAAARLCLTGEIDANDFLAVMAGEHPRSPGLHLGRRYGDDSVRGFDVTCSAPKSVSVLFAVGDHHTRREMLTAHDEAVATTVRWIEHGALTRHRINGEVTVVDADGLIAATFRQHTSRSLDPQLHAHIVIANKVTTADGRWLALDARGLKLDQRPRLCEARLMADPPSRRPAESWARSTVAQRYAGAGKAQPRRGPAAQSSSTMMNRPCPWSSVLSVALGDGFENWTSPHSPYSSGGSTSLSPVTAIETV